MNQVSKLKITNLNPHLTCLLCRGYFIEATTIIECLHSFCKSCIVKYLETNKFCPVCEVQVHKTKPLLNIRSDQTLQDIVYKLVPGLFQHEMRLRRDFYNKHPDQLPPNPEDRGEVTDHFIYSSDETICLSLEYADDILQKEEEEDLKDDHGSQMSGKRFLRCPAAVTVGLLKRLIRGKYGLDNNHALDILYGDSFLCDEYSLVDLAYIYNWRRKGPMRLRYRIYHRLNENSLLVNGTTLTEEETKEIRAKEEQNADSSEKVQMEVNDNGLISLSNVDTKNEETCLSVSDAVNEPTSESYTKIVSPKLETSGPQTSAEESSAVESIPKTSLNENNTDETPKTEVSAPTKDTSSDALVADTAVNSTMANEAAVTKCKTMISLTTKAIKPPPLWNQNANRVGIKRASSAGCEGGNSDQTQPTPAKRATPTSPTKSPRFFKVRNATQISGHTDNPVNCKAAGSSIASVTESPVQEVAVNLTKASNSPKKPSDKERSAKEGRAPSPRSTTDSVSINPIRPYSAPAPTQSPRPQQSTTNLTAEDAAARLRHISNPILLSTSTASSSSDGALQQLRYPAAAAAAWLNLARGMPNRPAPLTLGANSPFSSRPPLSPAHFISSFIASHPHYPYLSPMGLPPPHENKKSIMASTSSASLPVSQQSHKPISPRTSNSFPTPTFNLNALQQCGYPPSLSPLLPSLPRDLVGSFYHSTYVPRPFMTGRGTSSGSVSVSSKSPSSTASSGGFHLSLPPTVTTATSNSTGKKSSPGLRPLAPRRAVAPPPPLVPIGSTPAPTVRSPPTLLPLKDAEKEPSSSKSNTSSTITSSVTVVESSLGQAEEDNKSTNMHPDSLKDEPVRSPVENQGSSPKQNGKIIEETPNNNKAEASTTSPPESSSDKTGEDKPLADTDKAQSEAEVASTAAS